jgi:hypothetical protein
LTRRRDQHGTYKASSSMIFVSEWKGWMREWSPLKRRIHGSSRQL